MTTDGIRDMIIMLNNTIHVNRITEDFKPKRRHIMIEVRTMVTPQYLHSRRWVLALLLGIAALTLAGIRAHATSSADLDIGSPLKAGATSFTSGVYTIAGSGADIGNRSDQFHFNRGTLAGNGSVTAYIASVGRTVATAKSGVMLRNDVAPASAFAAVVVTPGAGVLFQCRVHAGGMCISTQAFGVKAPVWVRLTRRKNRVVGSYSRMGLTWTQIGKPASPVLGRTALAGIAVSSHTAALSVSTFTNVAVTPDVDPRYLHTSGSQVRDQSGRVVTLRGANIGGWLVTEGWMCGQSDNSGRFALEELEARFGPAKASKLINAWRDNWFTDRDMDNIRSYGFNLIRVPFSWRNLQDADGNWYRDAQGGIDFSRFDWVVQEAAKRDIYVIFVLHLWPGQQKNYGDICQGGELGAAERTQASSIWSALTKHFRGNGTIAAYDLINEPTGSNDFYAAHRAFYAAIRTQEPERMLVAEWVNTGDFPKLGWTDTMCSGHYPAGSNAEFAKFMAELPKHNEYSTTLPCFVGEAKSEDTGNVAGNAADMTRSFDRVGWGWAVWTYKTVNQGGWGLFDYTGSVSYNLEKDTYDKILETWTVGLTRWQNPASPSSYYLKSEIIAGLKQGATDTVAAQPLAAPATR